MIRSKIKTRLRLKRQIIRCGCWIWTGLNTAASQKRHPNNLIYGVIKVGSKSFRVHRLSWMVYRGKIPRGKNVLHRCDRSLCFNPDHLFIGTQLENMRDCVAKDRHARGEEKSTAKLTDSNVRLIRKLASGGISQRALAKRFGIGKSLAGDVVRLKRWKHVK